MFLYVSSLAARSRHRIYAPVALEIGQQSRWMPAVKSTLAKKEYESPQQDIFIIARYFYSGNKHKISEGKLTAKWTGKNLQLNLM